MFPPPPAVAPEGLWRGVASKCAAALAKEDESGLLDHFKDEVSCHQEDIFYVYILQSEIDPAGFYTGFTKNLETRLKDHNTGKDFHTAEFKPWKIKTAVAFSARQKALDFMPKDVCNTPRVFKNPSTVSRANVGYFRPSKPYDRIFTPKRAV